MPEKKDVHDRAGLIRNAMYKLREVGFSVDTTGKILGYDGNVGNDIGYLGRELIDRRLGKNVEERSRLAIAIADLLEKSFERDQQVIKKWVKVPLPEFGKRSFKDMVSSGSTDNLRKALKILKNIEP
jgi:hypothetical protein